MIENQQYEVIMRINPIGMTNEDGDLCLKAEEVKELVRCKDCVHRDPEDRRCDCGELERAGAFFAVADYYFCAYGERRKTNG